MNLGNQIHALRKAGSITQEELAAELGVTAAAVSKWENGVCLPDILMLCALADYFGVTTDELLGRRAVKSQAVVAAQTEELGRRIADLARRYHIHTAAIFTDYNAALAFAESIIFASALILGLFLIEAIFCIQAHSCSVGRCSIGPSRSRSRSACNPRQNIPAPRRYARAASLVF